MHFTAEVIFRRLFSALVSQVVVESNLEFQRAHNGPAMCRLRVTPREVWSFVATILRIISYPEVDECTTLRSVEFGRWSGLSQTKASFLFTKLVRPYELLVTAFNEGLTAMVQAGGQSAIDEAIWPWYGKSPLVIHMPDKPNPYGLRCFAHMFALTRSGLPVPTRIMPELCRPVYPPHLVLNTLGLRTYSSSFSITLISARLIGCFAFSPLFSYELPFGTHRVFQHGRVCVSVFQDEGLHICASNAFTVSSLTPSQPRPLHAFGISFADRRPLPPSLIPVLERATLDDLKALAHAVAVPTAGTKLDLVHRICELPLPSSSGVSSSAHSPTSASSSSSSVTTKGLKAELTKFGQRTTGNKERLERRLELAQAAPLSRSRCQSVLQDFLGAYTPVPPDEEPLLNGIYHATFNLVDRFDHLVSNIHYTPRIFSEFNRVFIR